MIGRWLALFTILLWSTLILLSVGGIFGAHALFFTALRHAPAVEVNLLQYLPR